jgi:hypothetical protein
MDLSLAKRSLTHVLGFVTPPLPHLLHSWRADLAELLLNASGQSLLLANIRLHLGDRRPPRRYATQSSQLLRIILVAPQPTDSLHQKTLLHLSVLPTPSPPRNRQTRSRLHAHRTASRTPNVGSDTSSPARGRIPSSRVHSLERPAMVRHVASTLQPSAHAKHSNVWRYSNVKRPQMARANSSCGRRRRGFSVRPCRLHGRSPRAMATSAAPPKGALLLRSRRTWHWRHI